MSCPPFLYLGGGSLTPGFLRGFLVVSSKLLECSIPKEGSIPSVETEESTSLGKYFIFLLIQTASGFIVAVTTRQTVINGSQSITVSIKVTPTSFVAKGK